MMILLPVLLALSGWLQQPPPSEPPIAGVWKLNPEKSGMRCVPADYVESRQYSMRAD